MQWNIALRNVIRNKRRTAINILMIVSGFVAIVLFRGFSDHLIVQLEDMAINTQFGNVQVATDKFWSRDPQTSQRDKLIPDYESLIKTFEANPQISYAGGRLTFFGLIAANNINLSARGWAFDPFKETKLLSGMKVFDVSEDGSLNNLKAKSDSPFDKNNIFQIVLGAGLQENLKAKMGQPITIISQTIDGAVNAVDLEMKGVFQTQVTEFDDSTFFLPLAAAQRLLDTDRIERIVIAAHNKGDQESVFSSVKHSLLQREGLIAKGWKELAYFYRQVEEFWFVQNGIVTLILFSIVCLSILNTVSTSIYERTGEIGTTRALGDTEKDTLYIFLREGIMLWLISTAIALPLSYILAFLINSTSIPITMPGASQQLTVVISVRFVDVFFAGCIALVTTLIATYIPAYHASKMNIVDALRRNI